MHPDERLAEITDFVRAARERASRRADRAADALRRANNARHFAETATERVRSRQDRAPDADAGDPG